MWPFREKDPFKDGYKWAKKNIRDEKGRVEALSLIEGEKEFGTYGEFDKGIEKYLEEKAQ